MEFRTVVDIEKPPFELSPCERILFVGSCFADGMGHQAQEEMFRAMVNPYGVMYNPASILHTVARVVDEEKRLKEEPFSTVVLTLGTNHVYILKDTGDIVDNCQKRPQCLFEERELSVDECAGYLFQVVELLYSTNPDIRVILTVSPIRYRKYGYHNSQLSKSTLLLAVAKLLRSIESSPTLKSVKCYYFPAYEIVLDELRDYRFYAPDMLHPSEQTVEYIWQRFGETLFSAETKGFLTKWHPLKNALAHRPFNPESPEYQAFLARTHEQIRFLKEEYPNMEPTELFPST